MGLLFSIGVPRRRPEQSELTIETRALAKALPESVKSAIAGTLNICGFVVFFSVVTALLDALGVFSGAAGWLAARLGAELTFTRALLTGLLELGSGISAMRGLAPVPVNLALASLILGFGSLSVHCQTLSAIGETELRFSRHFAGRLLHGALAALFTFLSASVLFAA